jgi:biopolymer transport protein ExbD
MLSKRHESLRMFSDFSTLQFASAMCMVWLAPLALFMTYGTPHHPIGWDPPRVSHPISMPGALRENAMIVTVARDGQTFFGPDQIMREAIAGEIQNRLKDHSLERKVYLRADMWTYWGSVKPVLHAVRSAGIIRVAFRADQRRGSDLTH